ncbi:MULTISPECIES: hypothetical protein [unclassified Moorena]|uniref:hypothetical protein n=1 Tax=unclassified Moorena TaxID=2683338 RepID=UPI0013CB21D5|nr:MULTISPECIES: hypothetical protein [unclassified Moorena]NEO20839.1 hypothetical protein [Moorena sp. SIO4A5]NEQ60527.1 hypothetical protein [Moorena sp. SIO4A1]
MTTTTSGQQVKFIQYHQPALESGEYHIKVEQTISDTKGRIPEGIKYEKELIFSVIGERFEPLTPQDIYAVFPPPESLGDHSNVLPHITVNRSTLPWERYPGQSDENLTWLVLLLFWDSDFEDDDDKPKLKTITLGELVAGESGVKFPSYTLDGVGQTADENTTVFDIKKKYVADILPTKADIAYVSHVRKAEDLDVSEDATEEEAEEAKEFATVVCSRLPQPNGTSYVHLISVEGRYGDDGFDFQGAGDEDLIRFVSLANWSFSCVDPKQTFTEILKNLNRTPSTPRLPVNENSTAEKSLAMGYVPLSHSLREGSQTVSWYHGPLATGFHSDTYEFPAKAADELLRYDPELGLFDTSYAAAWQLGRMLTLQNSTVATSLYNWKRAFAQRLKQLENILIHLPLTPKQSAAPIDLPLYVFKWFRDLELLKGIPFNYLVPDEKLLPSESIRFFCVDSLWVDCLQDGAFSIGRVTGADVTEDTVIRSSNSGLTRSDDQKLTGIIMRSQVVAGWPGLLVDGYDTAVADGDSIDETEGNLLPLLRMEKLAKDVLICIFQGEVKTVDIHQKPEAMHFGVDPFDVDDTEVTKDLRNANGELIVDSKIPVPWNNSAKRVINLVTFAENIKNWFNSDGGGSLDNFTSAQFGLQMMEGVQKVRFVKEE